MTDTDIIHISDTGSPYLNAFWFMMDSVDADKESHHEMTAVIGGVGADSTAINPTYNVTIHCGGIIDHSHRPICRTAQELNRVRAYLDKSDAIGLLEIKSHHVKGVFTMEDTLFHIHGPNRLYLVVDGVEVDGIGREPRICIMDVSLSKPVTISKCIYDTLHTHDISVVRVME
jgi:hypothetical protein